MEAEIVAVDLDGTLCETAWTPKQAREATPYEEEIKKTNEIAASGYFVIIYTARADDLIPATLEWLRRHNIRYDAICNKKMVADHYVDDKNKTFKELLNGET